MFTTLISNDKLIADKIINFYPQTKKLVIRKYLKSQKSKM